MSTPVAVIVTVPSPTPVTVPAASTVARPSLDDVHVYPLSVPFTVVADSVVVCPIFRPTTPDTKTWGSVPVNTWTPQVPTAPVWLPVAEMTAVPALTPVTTPVTGATVATVGSEDVQA